MTSNLALARTWRPKNFAEVVGQEHILQALTNALTQNRLHHAYLFSGTRGVGKTTIARILAKCLNCETGVTATPCCKCDSCLEIDAGRFIDLLEVDAASRTKVEDTRDLLDNVQYLPAKGRYKVYLIDEVHMLSGHSFNALLKTLEEPPAHVKFLFATTDQQKLPITILSRCLHFKLKAISPLLISKQLKNILEKEQVGFEFTALEKLAIAAQGSIRDGLSLLDQAIAYSDRNVTTANINAMLGLTGSDYIFSLLNALGSNNPVDILATINHLAELAVDFTNALNELLTTIHQITLLQAIPSLDTTTWQDVTALQSLVKQFTPEDLQLYYQIGLIGKRDLALAPTPKIGFEMIMLRMLAFTQSTPQPIQAKTILTNKHTSATPTNQITTPEKPTSTVSQENKPPVDRSISTEPKNLDTAGLSKTPQLDVSTTTIHQEPKQAESKSPVTMQHNTTTLNLADLKLTGPTLALAQHCIVSSIKDNHVELLLDPAQAPLLNKKHEERLSSAYSTVYGKDMTVTINIGTTNMGTQTNIDKQERAQKLSVATQEINQDDKIQQLIKTFDATIIQDSIR